MGTNNYLNNVSVRPAVRSSVTVTKKLFTDANLHGNATAQRTECMSHLLVIEPRSHRSTCCRPVRGGARGGHGPPKILPGPPRWPPQNFRRDVTVLH